MPPRVKLNSCFRQITTKNYTTTIPPGIINNNHILSCAFCCALWFSTSRFLCYFVNFSLHFSLFSHCFRRKILIFCSLRVTIITFITIIPQFAAIFKCFPLTNANKPPKYLDISLKTLNFSPKTLICHSDNKKLPS